jgi:hypothetical protein
MLIIKSLYIAPEDYFQEFDKSFSSYWLKIINQAWLENEMFHTAKKSV